MPESCKAVSLDFPCAASAVWQVLSDASGYQNWFGYPDARAVAEGAVSLGGKLRFKNIGGTTIVTALEPGARLELSTGAYRDLFTLEDTQSGCTVTLVTACSGNPGWNGTEAAREATNRAILRRLKAAVLGGEAEDAERQAARPAPKERGVLKSVAANLLHGYKTPILLRKPTAFDDSVELANIIDHTEADVAIHLRAAIAALALCVALFSVLFVCGDFERSDIVPSSGLSVIESDSVNRENAELLYIGQGKNNLELMLSCRGVRLSQDEYVYSSEERDASGESVRVIYVTYDAYGNVRRFAFVDRALSRRPLEIKITDVGLLLDARMTVAETERFVGAPVSAFTVDKSGMTTVFFGILDTGRDLFDSALTSELMLKIDRAGNNVQSLYYAAYDPENPMPYDELDREYRRQYSNLTYFLADRAAYERIFLLAGKTRQQADAILGTEGVDYVATYDLSVICSYSCRSAVVDEALYRYQYNVTFNYEDVASKVTFRNGWLEAKDNMLLDYESYALQEGMSLYGLYRAMSMLPTYAEYDGVSLILCYGSYEDIGASTAYSYNLTVELDAASRTVTAYSFNR